jgi:feruloyl esterase
MRSLTLSLAVAAVAALLLGSVRPAQAQTFADVKNALVDYSKSTNSPRKACDAMAKFKAKELVEIHAAAVPAANNVPAHCRVTGRLAPEIAFEVSLPEKWNERFYMIGNGGHAGESLEAANRVTQRNDALRMGFAFAQTNTGHDSSKESGASFVMSDPQKAIDYAYRAVHLTAVTAKDITKDYYGKAVSKAYWNSCSNGGRQGLMEAQRYPDDFDGIVANAPWLDQTGFTVGAMWNQRALSETPVSAPKLAMLATKVMEKCDTVDGLKDGLIDDPRKCSFDARVDAPACRAPEDGPDCLTGAQADAIMKVYSGPVSNGKPYFPGYMLGSEAVTVAGSSNWLGMIVGAQSTAKPADFNLAEGTMRYLVQTPPKPDWDFKSFNFDKDIHMLDDWSKKADAKNPDLSKFRKEGGKILMTYGWADQVLQPMVGVKYFEDAVAKNGPNTTDFLRLFMVPGMAHCSGGAAATDRFDAMTALINWVEKDKAPDSIPASRVVNNQVVRTRPLCPYPQVARFSGVGSIDDARNFTCVKP